MSSKTHGHMNASNNEMDVCADCSQPNPIWASINHGTLVCDQCAIIHRTLGRFISQIKPWKQTTCWKLTQLQMVFDLYRSGSNSIWEHTLLDPLSSGSTMSHNIKGLTGSHSSYPRRKPQPNDPLYPHKSDFIRAKYQFLAYVNKSNGIKDDVESESDISEQLHSSVRTPNLKTSLRLLVAGANPNYIHSEKFNSPLHMAARSGQMSQIELLLIYGANLAVVDSKNKSAIDYAKEAGHQDIVYRLIEHQFDLSDTLTRFICQGRQPNHRNGEHFLIVDIKSDFLNYLENNNNNNNGNSTGNENDNQRQILETFRNELHQSIRQLSHKSFQELARDVFDELDRREINSFVTSFYSNENGKLSILHQQLSIPFLPVYQYFSPTRNQGRQKLALLNTKEFTLLIVDVLNEIRRRVYGLPTIGCLRKDDSNRNPNELDDEDSEPLYDSVPSEEDYDECNEVIINSNQPMSLPSKLSKNEPKYSSIHNNKNHNKDENDFVSMSEYIALKEQIIKSTGLMEVFLSDNKLMRNEMSRLQTIVEKLVDENVQLRQQLINFVPPPPLSSCTSSPQNSSSLLRSFYLNHNNNNEHKSNSMLIESSSEQLNHHDNNSGGGGGSFHNNNHVQINDNNRIRPRSISNHHLTNNNNNNNNYNYNGQINTSNNQKNQLLSNELLTTIKSPSNLNQLALSVSPTKSSNSSIGNYFSPSSSSSLIQQQRNISPHFNQIFNPSEMFTTNSSPTPPSSSSSLSSQIPLQQQQQPCQNSVGPPTAKSSALNTVVSSSPSFPTKDDVIKKIEFITNGIKLLLLKAKEGKHDEFKHCSERICNYVSDMINLFPESIESSKMDNLLQLNQALLMLQNNVMQLHDECHTYENVPRFQHCNTSQDNRHIYNMVIDKAAEVAASVKSIINLYTIQANSVGGGGLNNNHNTTNNNSGKIQSSGAGGNITTTNPQTPGSNAITPPTTNTTTTMASVDRLS